MSSFKENHTDTEVSFTVNVKEEAAKELRGDIENTMKQFKLTSVLRYEMMIDIMLSTTNYFLFDPEGHIHHYGSAEDIINSFIEYRLPFYQKRREVLMKQMNDKLTFLQNKARFLEFVISGSINLRNRPIKEIEKDIEQHGVIRISRSENTPPSYDYLLSIPLSGLTKEKCDELKKEIDVVMSMRSALENKTSKDLWMEDLYEFRDEFLKVMGY